MFIAHDHLCNPKITLGDAAIAGWFAVHRIRLFAFPVIGHALGLSDEAYGLWAGLAIDNTAVGSNALSSNIDGGANTAVGAFALEFNDFNGNGTADNNTALGSAALIYNINAAENTAVGSLALHNNDSS